LWESAARPVRVGILVASLRLDREMYLPRSALLRGGAAVFLLALVSAAPDLRAGEATPSSVEKPIVEARLLAPEPDSAANVGLACG